MKVSEFRKLIREEVRKVIKEAEAPAEAQDFAKAAKTKYKNNLLAVDFIKNSRNTIVTVYIDMDYWKLSDKYWANKYTATLGNNTFVFKAVPKTQRGFKPSDMIGTEVPTK